MYRRSTEHRKSLEMHNKGIKNGILKRLGLLVRALVRKEGPKNSVFRMTLMRHTWFL